MARRKSLKRYRRECHVQELFANQTRVAALEGRLGLGTEEKRNNFYGEEWLSLDEKLDMLIDAEFEQWESQQEI